MTLHKHAFTRLELVAVVAAVGLLTIVALPLLGGIGPRAERVACVNNLRLISRAFLAWAGEHGGMLPWQTPMLLGGTGCAQCPGGMHPEFQYPWFQWLQISNQLVSPRVLSDPGDKRMGHRSATDWYNNPTTGYMDAAALNNALSYLLGLNALPQLPQAIIASDRNLKAASRGTSPYGFVGATLVTPEVAAWTNAIHGAQGNLAFMDGHVEETDDAGLRQAISWNSNWNNCFLPPF
jgi:prepilin-type processing-associated H-X9-DG protein